MKISINPNCWSKVTKTGRLSGEIRIGRTVIDLLSAEGTADKLYNYTGEVEVIVKMGALRPVGYIVEDTSLDFATFVARKKEEEAEKAKKAKK